MVPSLVVCVTSTCAHEPNDSVRRHGQRGFRRECGGHARRVEARRALSARAAGACFFSGLQTRVESARPRVPGRSEWEMCVYQFGPIRKSNGTDIERSLASSPA